MATYVIPEAIRMQYAGLYLLRMAESPEHDFSLALAKEEKVLEPIFKWLLDHGYIEISKDNSYKTSVKGHDVLQSFIERYREFVRDYDVFCAVDLAAGEFAFSWINEFDTDEEWLEFLHEDRWDDLRVAVAEFKGLDPLEAVLMSFMNEGRFGESAEGWDYELLLGSVWEEIATVCNTAIKIKNLAYSNGDEIISGEDVISDIVARGAEVLAQVR